MKSSTHNNYSKLKQSHGGSKSATEMSNISPNNKLSSSNFKGEKQNLLSNFSSLNSNEGQSSEYDLPIEKDIPITNDILNQKDSKAIAKSINFKQKLNKKFNIQKTRKGNMIMFLYNKKGHPLIVIGPHWPFTLCMMFFIDLISFCYFYFLWNYLYFIVRWIGLIILNTQIFSYLLCFLMDPGIPSKDLWIENYFNRDENCSKYLGDSKNDSNYKNMKDNSNSGTNILTIKDDSNKDTSYRICNICKIIMKNNDQTEHCEECNICIIGCDHHCPWTSKCVGRNNKKVFYSFVVSSFLLIFYFILALFTIGFLGSKKLPTTLDKFFNNSTLSNNY